MKNTVTSNKKTGATVDKKRAAAPESKAVEAAASKAAEKSVATKTKAAAVKSAVKPESVSILETGTNESITICPEAIALRAYLLWEASGYQHGRHDEHWLQAEKLVKLELCS